MGKEPEDQTVINIKKLSKEEKDKVKRAIKKKRRKEKIREGRPTDRDLLEKAMGEFVDGRQSDDEETANTAIEEEDEYLLAGKDYEEFKNVFAYFRPPKLANLDRIFVDEEEEERKRQEEEKRKAEEERKKRENADPNREAPALSNKKRKQLKRMQVAQLKVLVKRPDLVEAWDVTAPYPLFLIQLKSYKNTVPVPRHWCQKRKFLQNKRGILKPPFKLPDFIEATGISRLRDPLSERDGAKMIRQRLRERMNPKLGKIDIDYDVLHDAFFVHQKKPHMTIHGDIYFEGKEDEVKMRSYKPGKISDELRRALGISETSNPPWLITMQRFGPPPSYPHLKIPGLNSNTISDSQLNLYLQKAAEDEEIGKMIQTMYGNRLINRKDEAVDKGYFGALKEIEDVDEVESQAGIENEMFRMGDGFELPNVSAGNFDPSTFTPGLETPSFVDIRKTPRAAQSGLESRFPEEELNPSHQEEPHRPLYQVMEKKENKAAKGFIAPDFKYDMK